MRYFVSREKKQEKQTGELSAGENGGNGKGKGKSNGQGEHEDRELVKNAKQDHEAFDKLYAKYLKKVYTYIYYRVGSVEEAEDLTSNVFLQAFIHLDRYEYQGVSFSAWLLRIAHNMVANWYRDNSNRQWVDLDDWKEMASAEELPGENLEREEDRERVKLAVSRLPAEKQQVLILRFAEGMKHKEIAEVVGKSPGAVKVLVHRSLSSVHRLMHGSEGGESN